jgi:hypothetical protein
MQQPKKPSERNEKSQEYGNNLECFDSDALRWRQASIKSINQQETYHVPPISVIQEMQQNGEIFKFFFSSYWCKVSSTEF